MATLQCKYLHRSSLRCSSCEVDSHTARIHVGAVPGEIRELDSGHTKISLCAHQHCHGDSAVHSITHTFSLYKESDVLSSRPVETLWSLTEFPLTKAAQAEQGLSRPTSSMPADEVCRDPDQHTPVEVLHDRAAGT